MHHILHKCITTAQTFLKCNWQVGCFSLLLFELILHLLSVLSFKYNIEQVYFTTLNNFILQIVCHSNHVTSLRKSAVIQNPIHLLFYKQPKIQTFAAENLLFVKKFLKNLLEQTKDENETIYCKNRPFSA